MNVIASKFKPNSLKMKWAIAAATAIFMAFFLFSLFQYKAISTFILDEEESSFRRVLDEMGEFFQQRGPDIRIQDIYEGRELMKQIVEKDQSVRILARNGKSILEIRSETQDTYTLPFVPVQQKKIAIVEANNMKTLIGRSPINSSQFNGYIEIVQPLNRYENIMQNAFWMMIFSGAFALVLSAVLGYFMAKKFVQPLKRLSTTMKSIQEKGFQERMDEIDSHDEISELSKIFNKMMDQIERSFSQQQQFVEDASHELRTPVQILEGHLSLLNRWGKDDPEVLEESLGVSLHELQRMKKLVNELLQLSRSDHEQTNTEEQRSDAVGIVRKVVKDFTFLHKDYLFTLNTPEDESLWAKIIPRHLEQVVIILMDNAVKYSEKGSSVSVEVAESKNNIKFIIKDEGIGIPEEDLPKIFDRFYRVDKARSRERGGNGLGLAIANKIVVNNGGEMKAESIVNEGTTITFTIEKLK
jgi:two-component system, OmpR family, sensor histidine kinase ArlS